MVYKFFNKKSSGVATMPNYQLANELHRQIIRNFKRGKVYSSSFRDNTWCVNLADMQSHHLYSNEKDRKFKVGDHVRISKYKSICAKGYTQNWSEEVFITSKIQNTVPWTYVISDLNGEPITGGFYEQELQKTNQKNSE